MIIDGYGALWFLLYAVVTYAFGLWMEKRGFLAGINQTLISLGTAKSKAIQDAIKILNNGKEYDGKK